MNTMKLKSSLNHMVIETKAYFLIWHNAMRFTISMQYFTIALFPLGKRRIKPN